MRLLVGLLIAGLLSVSPALASSVSYSYDNQGRLLTATYAGATTVTITYAYDFAGNRTSVVTH
jgi:YD repeat-containing protein